MFDNNFHNNSSCAFAETAISFLYDEIDAREKARFAAHLQKCSSCADEVASFNAVRSSIVEWKDLEFAVLETPSIEIPGAGNFEQSKTASRFTSFRLPEFGRLFARFSTAAVLAAILVCIGIAIFAIKFSSGSDIAGSEIKNSFSASATETNRRNTVAAGNNSVELSSNESPKLAVTDVKEVYRTAKGASKMERKNTIVKVAENSGKTDRNSTPTKYAPRIESDPVEFNKSRVAQTKKLPKLNNLADDVEDKSLRLAELFDDGR